MKKIFSTTLLLLSTSFLLAEEPQPINTALKFGTLGVGLDASTAINNSLSLRFNLNGGSYTDTQKDDNNEYDGTLNLLTAGLLLDYYPFENNFRFTSGVYYNGNNFTGVTIPTTAKTVEIDGVNYTTDDLNKLNTDVTFQKVAPYLGVGWGNDAHDKGWGFTFDLGVMYHGSADVSLEADVKDANKVQEIKNALVKEELSAEDELNDYPLFPVVMLGVNYSF